jgi:hypothetical protein
MDPFTDDLFLDPLLYGFDNSIDDSDFESEDEGIPPMPFHYEGIHPQEDDRKKRAPELSRDYRLMIQTLYQLAGWTQTTIFQRRNNLLFPLPDLTIRQIQTACDTEARLMPQKSTTGVKPKVIDDQKAAIKAFLEEKPEHCLIPWQELLYYIDYLSNVCDVAVKRTLQDMKYFRT